MKVLPGSAMREAEESFLRCGALSSLELMEAAIDACLEQAAVDPVLAGMRERYRCAIVYAGKGKNAGDALGLARKWGFTDIRVRLAASPDALAPETREMLRALPNGEASCEAAPITALPPEGALLLDGLLGSGAKERLRPAYAQLVEEMNALRAASPRSYTLALDVPTGLHAAATAPDALYTRADATLAIGCVKTELIADGAEDATGRIICVPLLEEAIPLPESHSYVPGDETLRLLPRRAYSCYKNRAGRVRIVAGSPGYIGAAQMCAEAAVAAGAGLVELCCLPEIYPILAARVAAEIMVRPVQSYAEVSSEGAQALLIGPGLGKPDEANRHALRRLAQQSPCPLVLDADGLNLAAADGWQLPPHAILTPHPGEIRRLFPDGAGLSRRACAAAYVAANPCILLLKGARTIITDGKRFYYNGSGGPWMANGGQGDVLSGAIAAFAAQGATPLHAAVLGAWLCGAAASAAWAAAGRPLAVRATSILPYLTALTKKAPWA